MSSRSELDNISVPVAILIGSVIVAASVVFVGYRLEGTAAKSLALQPNPAAAAPAQPQAQKAVDVKTVKTSSPFVGNASAPVAMAYWYDYQCPFCKRYEAEVVSKVYDEYVKTGKIRIVFKSMQFLGPDSVTLGIMERAVWEAAPSKFYNWHKAMFENQGREHSGYATKEFISNITTQVLGKQLSDRAISLAASKEAVYKQAIEADRAEGAGYGIRSTPTSIAGTQLIIGAKPYAEVKAAIDEALKK